MSDLQTADGANTNPPLVLNDDLPARTSRAKYVAGVNVPELTFVDSTIDNRISKETSNELGSDLLPMLIMGGINSKVGDHIDDQGNKDLNTT